MYNLKKIIMIGVLISILYGCSSSSSSTKNAIKSDKASESELETKIETNEVSILDEDLFKQRTTVLEYSNKQIDPSTLVEYQGDGITIETDGDINLSELGNYDVSYTLSNTQDEILFTKSFEVKDTHPPIINYESKPIEIEVGNEVDWVSCIKVSDDVDGNLQYYDEVEYARGVGGYAVYGYLDINTPGSYDIDVIAIDKHDLETKDIITIIVKQPTVEAGVSDNVVQQATYDYIANVKSLKFHYSHCRDVNKMKESNKWYITTTRDDLIGMGYSPCGHCNP